MRGYRSDTDLTVQTQFVDEFFVREVNRGKPRLSITVAVFIGMDPLEGVGLQL